MKREPVDCGDNSCMFRDRTRPSGMRTNGGCRCFGRSLVSTLGAEGAHKVGLLAAELRDLRATIARVEALRESWEDLPMSEAWAEIALKEALKGDS